MRSRAIVVALATAFGIGLTGCPAFLSDDWRMVSDAAVDDVHTSSGSGSSSGSGASSGRSSGGSGSSFGGGSSSGGDAATDAGSAEAGAEADAWQTDTGAVGVAADASDLGVPDAPQVTPEAAADAAKCNVLSPTRAVASSEGTVDVAANAIDRNFQTRWQSAQGTQSVNTEWIYVDFGAPTFMNQVQIIWDTACAQDYDIQVSNDAVVWVTVGANISAIGGPAPPADWSTAATYSWSSIADARRYLRVYMRARCTTSQIWEMRVFGDTNVMCRP